jgi:hypothetical protein
MRKYSKQEGRRKKWIQGRRYHSQRYKTTSGIIVDLMYYGQLRKTDNS